MAGRIHLRRRGRSAGLRELLVEREEELAVLERRLAEARDGHGGVTVIEAPAGKGKSRLLTVAGDMAREAGMQVLGAQATELERDFPFGVAIQLFEPRWLTADRSMREHLLSGSARRAGELLTGTLPEPGSVPGDQAYAVIHALFWLACNLASSPVDGSDGQPVAMLVDDGHWADRSSLRSLAYLAERITDLPIALIVAIRSGEPATDPQAIAALRNAAEDALLRPGSLSKSGVAAVVQSRFPDADAVFCEACARVTNGNPFLLVELLDQVRTDGLPPDAGTADRLAEMAPESVLNAVVARLGAMPVEAWSVASAVATLGDGAPLRQVARLARLDMEAAGRAADTLAATHLFHEGSPLAFVHPLIASAVRASMSTLDRGRAHRRAAQILLDEGAPAEQVAAHLLAAPPESDPRAVEALRAGARKALASGAAESAVRLLRRALAETPPPDIYPDVLAELGQAESIAGLPQAIERLENAIRVTDEGKRRAELALAQGRALYDQGRYRESASVVATALGDIDADSAPLQDDLIAAYIAAAYFVPELAQQAQRRGDEMLARLDEHPTSAQRRALAHIAVHGSLRGQDRVTVLRVAELAWGDGELLEAECPDARSWTLITGALLFVDELEHDLEICDIALATAREQDSPAAYAAASYCRAWPLYEQGRIAEAEADAQMALDARPGGWQTYFRTAYGAIACCHLQRGQLEQAETALSIINHPEIRDSIQLPFLLDTRAQLRLAQLRPEDALADAMEAGRLQPDFCLVSPGAIPWRSTAALAHLALGDHARACELASEELEQARRIGVTRVVIRDLRVLGLASRGRKSLELLTEAVHTGEQYPMRLEYINALIELGAALRRANQRVAARDPLRKALELSHRCGASALEQRARTELGATGARPRRVMLSGLESLTPSERRVGELAARGLTTRQIAEALFVTPKTVEFHLRHIYRKLDIGSRSELADSLGAEGTA